MFKNTVPLQITIKLGDDILPAQRVVLNSKTKITITVPDNISGIKAITVSSYNGDAGETTASDMLMVTPKPVISGFSPTMAVAGQTVTISGENLNDVQTVLLGGENASILNKSASTIEVQVNSPSNGLGIGKVRLESPACGAAESLNDFIYIGQPTLQSLNAQVYCAGGEVVVTGTYFINPVVRIRQGGMNNEGIDIPANTITVNQMKTELRFIIPNVQDLPTTSDISITTEGGQVYTNFLEFVRGMPNIISFSPNRALQGEVITINGENFGHFAQGVTVHVGAALAQVTGVSNSLINAQIISAASGMIKVQTACGIALSAQPFIYPKIQSFTPQSGVPGTTLTILGEGFTGVQQVQVGGVNVQNFTVMSDTEISAVVKAGSNSGKITVVLPGQNRQIQSVEDFTYIPFHWLNRRLEALNVQSIIKVDNVFITGTQSQGIYRSTDGGNTWQQSSTGLSNLNVKTLSQLSSPTVVLAGTDGGGVFQSLDLGSTWSAINSGLGTPANSLVVTSFVSDANQTVLGTLAGTYSKLHGISSWSPHSWQRADNTMIANDQVRVRALLYGPPSQYIYAGTENLSIAILSGGQFTQFSRAPLEAGVTSFAVSPPGATQNGDIYAGTMGGHVLAYNLNTDTWDDKTTMALNGEVRTMAANASSIVVGLANGALVSNNITGGSPTWQSANSGFEPGTAVNMLTIIDSDLYAATSTGLYRTPANQLGSQMILLSKSAEIATEQVFGNSSDSKMYQPSTQKPSLALRLIPNPVSDETLLEITSNSPGTALVIVRTVVGSEIYRHELPSQAGGLRSMVLDVSRYVPGVYQVEVLLGGLRMTKTMIKQ